METITKEIHEKTGLVGKELENLVYATAYLMALVASDEEAKKHFIAAYERTL